MKEREAFRLNWISILILILIVALAIFVLTYVAHDRGSSMCAGCHGDCANCKKKELPQSSQK